jgi:hypothetical protein
VIAPLAEQSVFALGEDSPLLLSESRRLVFHHARFVRIAETAPPSMHASSPTRGSFIHPVEVNENQYGQDLPQGRHTMTKELPARLAATSSPASTSEIARKLCGTAAELSVTCRTSSGFEAGCRPVRIGNCCIRGEPTRHHAVGLILPMG